MHQERLIEKNLWILHYNSNNGQISHIKLLYALDVEDVKLQVQQFINATNDVVSEQHLEAMPSGFSIAFRFFPGKVQVSSDGNFHYPGE